jgi:carbon storage regulator
MLELTRKLGQEIVIGGGISVKVLASGSGRIELGIVAPRQIIVNRAEVQLRRAGLNAINPNANEIPNYDGEVA